MSGFHRSSEKKHYEDYDSHDQEVVGSLCRLSDRAGSPTMHMDQEKRMRREIANSNERRRMQSINAGFQSLRTLLPHHEGEKLSKAAILQQTAEYIYTLEQEKTRLLSQNCQLKRIINQHEGEPSTNVKKRKTESGAVTVVPAPVSESSDEGIGSMSPEPVGMGAATPGAPIQAADQESATEVIRREMMDLRMHLDRERRMRLLLEDQVRSLQSQLYPDRIQEIQQVQLQYHPDVPSWPEEPPLEEEMYADVKTESDLSHQLLHQTVVERDALPPRRESQCSSHSSSRLIQEDEVVPQHQASAIVPTPSLLFTVDPSEVSPLPLALPVSGVTPSPCPSPSGVSSTILGPISPPPGPIPLEPRLPSVLEAAIKAEPKVEVERLPSPSGATDDSPQARLYLANTSRQNLETIVEAIRHLEGDHLFSDDPSPHRQVLPTAGSPNVPSIAAIVQERVQERLQGNPEPEAQDMPLALTTTSRALTQQCTDQQRLLKVKMDPFHYQRTALQQQQRPGVIVVKQHT